MDSDSPYDRTRDMYVKLCERTRILASSVNGHPLTAEQVAEMNALERLADALDHDPVVQQGCVRGIGVSEVTEVMIHVLEMKTKYL